MSLPFQNMITMECLIYEISILDRSKWLINCDTKIQEYNDTSSHQMGLLLRF